MQDGTGQLGTIRWGQFQFPTGNARPDDGSDENEGAEVSIPYG